jgi:hypothetical protein
VEVSEPLEVRRLRAADEQGAPWKAWGPYLSERQWGTVRENYSQDGKAWEYLPHDRARSRAYQWGEDGLAGISDDRQYLCFALALWNGRDPIIKERLFGLTNREGNHGEDVKEYYFYLDSTPTHSYMKYLYKYPQRAYPYDQIVLTNRHRGRREPEYELLDTGVFDDDRYFDVVVEYAKGAPEDILIQITVENRGPEAAQLHVLPTLWFRNIWSWGDEVDRPLLREAGKGVIAAAHPILGKRYLACEGVSAGRIRLGPLRRQFELAGTRLVPGQRALMIRALMHFYLYYGDRLRVEFPTGSGTALNLFEIARELSHRLTRLFLRDAHGRRPVYGASTKFQTDPHWRDHIFFYEYFHGDTGAGLGASHQTGWTGIVARLTQLFAGADAPAVLEAGLAPGPRGRR